MKKLEKFNYPGCSRETIEGKRHYSVGEEKLPSVTTILQATQSEEKRQSLEKWKQRVGAQQADQIKNLAANRGTAIHKIIEKHILGQGYLDMTELGNDAHKMANKIIEQGLSKWDGYYGTEVTVHYPGLYAGQSDLIGVHQGDDAIGDQKQSNKPKQKEWIEDYLLQLAAYAMAHNQVYGTQIRKGVIHMVTPDLYYQEFIIEGNEYLKWESKWLRRIDQYYKGVK
jgi:genome maintenance exonuclease 1